MRCSRLWQDNVWFLRWAFACWMCSPVTCRTCSGGRNSLSAILCIMQALEKAKAAEQEVEQFTAALPPLPVWDSLPVPATGRDRLDPAGDNKAAIGGVAQPEQTSSMQGAAGTAAPSSAEAAPAAEPGARPAAGPSAASGDAQPVEDQPFASCDPPADPVADALATDEAAAGDSATPEAAGVDSALAPTDAADIEAEALAAADLAADSSVRDRRCE